MLSLLYIRWHVDPVLIHIGSFGLRWYSLLFVSGFIIGWFIVRNQFRREHVSETLLDPLLYTLLIGTIVGARLGHCIFYDPAYYFGSWQGFAEVFMPWKGGLASHGGTIVLFFALMWYAHRYGPRNGFDFMWLLDHICIPVALTACLIRCGNLFNSEIYGFETSLPWGMVYELRGETVPRHPTQMYEALTYLLLFVLLSLLYKYKLDKMYRGTFIGIFFVVCFGVRFCIEYVKDTLVPWPGLTSLTMGQILSIPFVLLGAGILIWAFIKKIPARAEPPQQSSGPSKKEPTHYARSLVK